MTDRRRRPELSRRRILTGAAWSAPAVVIATSVPARASSTAVTATGSWLVVTSATLTPQSSGFLVEARFDAAFNIYNDTGAFVGTSTSPEQALQDVDFLSWPVAWVATLRDAGGNAVDAASGTGVIAVDPASGGSVQVGFGPVIVDAGGPGSFVLDVVLSSSQVATVDATGDSFGVADAERFSPPATLP
ncbi:hypothetical protein [Demequina activiva]|uniref:Uncharacterized protein n=1 Tax=Demequina activiva TaxID=1582364 RepID=A0A919Q1Y5_9MICO|nr:hypothetical protein [Demequina activiva]GIG53762.1 hypothetical protein Dac01nite_05140 [Demequina activiva]